MGLSDEVWEELCTDPGALHRPQCVVDACGGKDSATAPAVLLDWRTAAASAREMSQLASAELRTPAEGDQHDTSTQGAQARGGQQDRQSTEMHDIFSCVGLRSPMKLAEEHILGTIKRFDSACQRAMNLFLPQGLDTADKKALLRGSSSQKTTQRFSPYPRKVSLASAAIRAVSSPHGRVPPTAGSHPHADSHSHMMTLSEQSKSSLQKRRQLARAVRSDAWARPRRDGVSERDGGIAGRQRQHMTEEESHRVEREGSAGGSKPNTLFAPFLIKTLHKRSN